MLLSIGFRYAFYGRLNYFDLISTLLHYINFNCLSYLNLIGQLEGNIFLYCPLIIACGYSDVMLVYYCLPSHAIIYIYTQLRVSFSFFQNKTMWIIGGHIDSVNPLPDFF